MQKLGVVFELTMDNEDIRFVDVFLAAAKASPV